jgi:hypothetical protein
MRREELAAHGEDPISAREGQEKVRGVAVCRVQDGRARNRAARDTQRPSASAVAGEAPGSNVLS